MKFPAAAAVVVAAISCSSAQSSPAAPTPPGAVSAAPAILAFGDSLTAGPGLSADETYPAVLQRKLAAAGFDYRVVNAGVSGETTSGSVRRLPGALAPDTRVLILATGANDGLRGAPIDTIRQNLREMIAVAQSRGIQVLLCGMETPPLYGFRYSLDFHSVFPQLAAEFKIPLVPFMLDGVLGRSDLNMADGIHPNAEGAAIVAGNIYPYLTPILRQTAKPSTSS